MVIADRASTSLSPRRLRPALADFAQLSPTLLSPRRLQSESFCGGSGVETIPYAPFRAGHQQRHKITLFSWFDRSLIRSLMVINIERPVSKCCSFGLSQSDRNREDFSRFAESSRTRITGSSLLLPWGSRTKNLQLFLQTLDSATDPST